LKRNGYILSVALNVLTAVTECKKKSRKNNVAGSAFILSLLLQTTAKWL